MLQILHFADLHLGVSIGPVDPKTGINGRVMDYLDTLDATLDYAQENKVDLIVIAGDCFHKPNPDPTILREFGRRVMRMGEIAPTVIIPGNHDLPGSLDRASSVDIFGTLSVPNVTLGLEYKVHRIITRKGMVQVGTAPWPRRAMFVSGKETRAEVPVEMYKQRVAERILDMANTLEDDFPAILVGHFTVAGSVYGMGQILAIGEAAEVELNALEGWDYVALGHIHLHQDLAHGAKAMPPVVYAGSLERVDFGDENDTKGFVWVEMGDEINYEFVEVDARPYITIRLDVTGQRRPMPNIVNQIKEMDLRRAIVRAIITVEQDGESKIIIPDIIKAIEISGAYYIQSASLQRSVLSVPRLTLTKPVESYKPLELVSLLFKEQGLDKSKRQPLLKLARDIMEEVNAEANEIQSG